MGPDWNKIEPAHGLSVPIFCSSLNLWSATRMIKSEVHLFSIFLVRRCAPVNPFSCNVLFFFVWCQKILLIKKGMSRLHVNSIQLTFVTQWPWIFDLGVRISTTILTWSSKYQFRLLVLRNNIWDLYEPNSVTTRYCINHDIIVHSVILQQI